MKKQELPSLLNELSDNGIDEKLIVEGIPVDDAEVTMESYCTCPNCRTRFYVSRMVPYARCPNSSCRMLLPLWGDKI